MVNPDYEVFDPCDLWLLQIKTLLIQTQYSASMYIFDC